MCKISRNGRWLCVLAVTTQARGPPEPQSPPCLARGERCAGVRLKQGVCLVRTVRTLRLAIGILEEVGGAARTAAQRGRLLRARQGPGEAARAAALRRAQAASAAAAAEDPAWEEERRRIDAAAEAELGSSDSD